MVIASLLTATPITWPEWSRRTKLVNRMGRSHSWWMTAHVMATVLHHATHWGWSIAAIWIVTSHWISGSHCLRERVGAAEACCATLEVGEATRWAGPVTWAWAILAWGKGGEDILSAVKYAAGRRRYFDRLLVKGAAVHTERFCCLEGVSTVVVSLRTRCTHFFVGGENRKAGSGWLMLIGSSESPESNWTATVLGKPRLKL